MLHEWATFFFLLSSLGVEKKIQFRFEVKIVITKVLAVFKVYLVVKSILHIMFGKLVMWI